MKPIETNYKGYRFRSRLEARWAVFFENLGLIWEYEPEGFEFEEGVKYLPDFWLPELDCWFEVKGPIPTDEDRQKAFLLSRASNKLVALASGQIKTEIIGVGKQEWEWPADGFSIELFAGEAWDKWTTKSFSHGLWDWFFEVDLPPFISSQFPDEKLGPNDNEERRRKIVELDNKYYFQKYSKAHPKYKWGRYEKSVSWRLLEEDAVGFALEPNDGHTSISTAYNAAKSARFEHGENG